jgi:hypothetical protein
MSAKGAVRGSIEDHLRPGVVQHQLDVLRGEITKTITDRRLERLISAHPIRVDLFSETVWGTIQWPKSMGRPITPTLAAAFKIDHTAWQIIEWGPPEARMSQELPLPTTPLSIWDGPNDSNYYRVTFMGYPSLRENAINVSFAAGVGWEKRIQVIPGYRIISPSGRAFHHLAGKRTVLETFNVLNKPFLAP